MAAESAEPVLAELDEIQARGPMRAEDLLRARALVSHADNDVRWQALIAIAEWIVDQPDEVWPTVVEHGASGDEDMRDGVATVLLEHVLEHHFEAYLPRIEQLIRERDAMYADTLGRCWPFGDAKERWHEVESLVEAFRP